MAARFGNAGASALVNSANAAYNSAQSTKDSLAGYQYELSAKTEADFNAYNAYLQTRANQVASDPNKSLQFDRTISSANKSYTSAEISRASMAVDYGTSDNRTKYGTISALRDAAIQNGDYASAQSLESKMASLSMTIQNQDAAAASKAQASSDRASTASTTALNKGYSAATAGIKNQMNDVQSSYRDGKMTPNQLEQFKQGNTMQLLQAHVDAYQQGATGADNNLSDFLGSAANSKYLGNLSASDIFNNDGSVKDNWSQVANDAASKTPVALRTGNNIQGMAYTLDANGVAGTAERTQLPGVTSRDAAGNVITTPSYQTGRVGSSTYDFTRQLPGDAGKAYPGVTVPGYGSTPVQAQIMHDASIGGVAGVDTVGDPLYKDVNGIPRRFMIPTKGNESKNLLGTDRAYITPNAATNEAFANLQAGKNADGSTNKKKGDAFGLGELAAGFNSEAGKLIGKLPFGTNRNKIQNTNFYGQNQSPTQMLALNQHKQDTIKAQQALKAAQDATARFNASVQAQAAAKTAANAKLLPVFQKPQAPIPTGNPAQMRPAIGTPGYVAPVTAMNSVPKTGNTQVDTFKAIEALRGGFY